MGLRLTITINMFMIMIIGIIVIIIGITIITIITIMMNREFTMRDWGNQPPSLGEGGEWDLRSGRDWGEVRMVIFMVMRMIALMRMIINIIHHRGEERVMVSKIRCENDDR